MKAIRRQRLYKKDEALYPNALSTDENFWAHLGQRTPGQFTYENANESTLEENEHIR